MREAGLAVAQAQEVASAPDRSAVETAAVIIDGKETVLKKHDSCVIEPNENREIINRGNDVCTIAFAPATGVK